MNNVTTTQPAASTIPQDAMASSVSPQPSPRINLPPPPNPSFTFPTRPSSSAPSSLSRSSGRRHQSAIEIPKIGLGVEPPDSDKSWPMLPNFSFNPGNNLSPENAGRRPRPPPLPSFSFNPGVTPATDPTLLSPSFQPPSPRTIPNHMGHRRGGSEFVGGKLKAGDPITLMSTSPTKSESGFASPTLAPINGPRRHQRGHSHRRSGAISSHDLSLILQASPSPSSRGSSAPTSPAGFRDPYIFPNVKDQKGIDGDGPSAREATPGEGVAVPDVVPEKPSQSMPELSPKPATRARVGFSDTLEFIPRPLSLISTDTTSTVRPGHSVSGSISSIASITNSTNLDRDSPAIIGSPGPRIKASSRPSTAGAVLERTSNLPVDIEGSTSPRRRNSMLMLNDLTETNPSASAMSTPTRTPKRWTFFGFDSFASAGSPTRFGPASTTSVDITTKECTDLTTSTSDVTIAAEDSGISQDTLPVEEKKKSGKKRQKRVKSWAGSILTRNSKSRAQKSKARRRSQTPPITRFANDDETDDFTETTDQSPGTETGTHPSQHMPPNPRKGKRPEARPEDEAAYPMIDLDAALGPFNTPTRDPQWDEAQKAGVPPKRQLHSAAGMRGFSGPGMHYHRRAESAPEMPPFEGARFSIHRFGSSSTMADVFEEEEEEEEEADSHTGESAAEDSTSESQGTTTGDEDDGRDTDDAASTPRQERSAELADPPTEISMVSSTNRKGSSSSLPAPRRVSNANSSSSLYRETIAREQTYPIATRREVVSTSSLENPDPLATPPRRETTQREFTLFDATSTIFSGPPMVPVSPYSMGQSSSFPSPRSPMSYDAHRISTAPSSVTDDNQYHSLLMGEPGPELVRLSMDAPSIHSANSTMTRESLFPGVQPRNMPFHEQRPASFTTTAFGRRRSSLASLSRLISSAHGERSKLSMEVPFETEGEKKSKTSKSKRLTRMMQFWKPRASSSS